MKGILSATKTNQRYKINKQKVDLNSNKDENNGGNVEGGNFEQLPLLTNDFLEELTDVNNHTRERLQVEHDGTAETQNGVTHDPYQTSSANERIMAILEPLLNHSLAEGTKRQKNHICNSGNNYAKKSA